MRTLYVAGPMSNLPDFNRPAFHDAAAQLRTAGFRVLNPAANEPPGRDPDWPDYMRMSLRQLADADGIALLDGWRDSRGASLEVHIARELGIVQAYVPEWLTLAGVRP